MILQEEMTENHHNDRRPVQDGVDESDQNSLESSEQKS